MLLKHTLLPCSGLSSCLTKSHLQTTMAQSLQLAATLAVLAFAPSAYAACRSFGIDFQTDGTYFQNNASTAPFTALQKFTGCQNDTAHNILVNPKGDQCECSTTPLLPDGKPQLVNCTSTLRDALFSGAWSLIIISNNGNGNPIAYQRDFSLDVGVQQTTTATPVATITAHSTIVENVTTSTTETLSTTVPATTTTLYPETTTTEAAHRSHGWGWGWPFHFPAPSSHHQPPAPPSYGWTAIPHPHIVKETKTLYTITQTVTEFHVSQKTQTAEPNCQSTTSTSLPSVPDHGARILPSIRSEPLRKVAEEAMESVEDIAHDLLDVIDPSNPAESRSDDEPLINALISSRSPSEAEKTSFLAARNARLSRQRKRSPDPRTLTLTASAISTSTVAGAVSTVTNTETCTITSILTVSSGTATQTGSTETVVVTTLPTPTYTWTVWVPFGVETTTETREVPVTRTVGCEETAGPVPSWHPNY